MFPVYNLDDLNDITTNPYGGYLANRNHAYAANETKAPYRWRQWLAPAPGAGAHGAAGARRTAPGLPFWHSLGGRRCATPPHRADSPSAQIRTKGSLLTSESAKTFISHNGDRRASGSAPIPKYERHRLQSEHDIFIRHVPTPRHF